ncbi:MAG: 50S ribosomal protein L9 [Armatimonadota bacterium]|nr:50S ribosomal protein L9 [Armatimonadota bacterium]MDR7487117.1 50S ribosomal protein L9 [Armatimonadota bacterium]MDR7533554.1 50S ribosomal protein L9 [Armatimonadota bacterium]MDR7536856.1 50S ribosomal protein L9 [Armatimonadota bacterium]
MKVVLLKDVPGTGKAGAVVEVKEGHARNYLLPRGLAVEATEGALRQVQHQRRAAQQRLERERQEIAEQKRRLEVLVLEIRARAGERGRLFGAVTSQQIAEALSARGFSVTRKQVELEDPIRVEGFYKVPVRLGPGLVAQVDVNVVGSR